MFNFIKKKAIEKRVQDEILYEYVLDEMEEGKKIKGLWAKAYALSSGDSDKVEPLYMQYRVQAIKDMFTSLEMMYTELPRAYLFKFISNGFKNLSEEKLAKVHEGKLKRQMNETRKEKETSYSTKVDKSSENQLKELRIKKSSQSLTDNESVKLTYLEGKLKRQRNETKKEKEIGYSTKIDIGLENQLDELRRKNSSLSLNDDESVKLIYLEGRLKRQQNETMT